MVRTKSPPAASPRGSAEAKRREARLAAALRTNLGRRKAQARAREEEPAPPQK